MNIQPTDDRILVKLIEPEKKTNGGIFLVSAPNEGPTTIGVVEATGPGRLNEEGVLIPNTVKVGDKVWWDPTKQVPVRINEQEYIITKDSDILAILD